MPDVTTKVTCPICHGEGYTDAVIDDRCGKCTGIGFVPAIEAEDAYIEGFNAGFGEAKLTQDTTEKMLREKVALLTAELEIARKKYRDAQGREDLKGCQ